MRYKSVARYQMAKKKGCSEKRHATPEAKSRIASIAHKAQKLYYAKGNTKTWIQCIKAVSKK